MNTLSTATFKNEVVILYPNPSTGSFKLNGITDNFNISIYNTLGQMVFSQDNLDVSRSIQSNLSKGVYIINIEVNQKEIFKKLIIN